MPIITVATGFEFQASLDYRVSWKPALPMGQVLVQLGSHREMRKRERERERERKREREKISNCGVRGEVAQTMYTHVSKCKNNTIKGEKKSVI
jgi:hypothetical protein